VLVTLDTATGTGGSGGSAPLVVPPVRTAPSTQHVYLAPSFFSARNSTLIPDPSISAGAWGADEVGPRVLAIA
jgi:hypothetical protein